jgi:anti-sigma-28 factor FlgM
MKMKWTQAIGWRTPVAEAPSPSREARVAHIATQVRSGTYPWPTSRQIADRMLQDAMLAASRSSGDACPWRSP